MIYRKEQESILTTSLVLQNRRIFSLPEFRAFIPILGRNWMDKFASPGPTLKPDEVEYFACC